MGPFPAIHAFMLSIKGWPAYVSIVIIVFAATWTVGFFIERRKSKSNNVKLAFFHQTTDIVNETGSLDADDLTVSFKKQQIRSLCQSHIRITDMSETDGSFGKTPLSGSLRIGMKDDTHIFDVRNEKPINCPRGLKISVSNRHDAVDISFDELAPGELVEIVIFCSRRSKLCLSGNIGGKAIKIEDWGEPSMKVDTNHVLILGAGIFAFRYIADHLEKLAADHSDSFGRNILPLVLIPIWILIVYQAMSSVMRIGRKRRLLRRLKLGA